MGGEPYASPWRAIGLVALSTLAAPDQAGDIDALAMFRNVSAHRTGDGPSLVDAGAFVSIRANTLGGVAYSSAMVDFPGPSSPQALIPLSPTNYTYQTATLASKAVMDSEFPAGTYIVALDDGGGSVVRAQFGLLMLAGVATLAAARRRRA